MTDKQKSIEKMLSDDKRQALRAALQKQDSSIWVYDYDDDNKIVYFERGGINCSSTYFKASYTTTDYTDIAIDNDWVEVRVQHKTEFVEKGDSVAKTVISWLDKYFGGSKESKQSPVVIKQFEEDEMIEISQLYVSPLDVDAHDDTIDREEAEKLVKNANDKISKGTLKANYDHEKDSNGFTSTDDFTFVKAFIAECDMTIGGNKVVEGTPLIKTKYHNKDVWEERKAGGFTGWSIGGRAGSYEWIEIEVDEE